MTKVDEKALEAARKAWLESASDYTRLDESIAAACLAYEAAKSPTPEPVYKAVERILDEHSAWITRPNIEVTGRIAFAATLAADSLTQEAKAAEGSLRDALWAGKPFNFDPAVGVAHCDDSEAPAGSVRWFPHNDCDMCMWDQGKPCTCGGAACEQVDFGVSITPAPTPEPAGDVREAAQIDAWRSDLMSLEAAPSATSGVNAYNWRDKPHRVLYDAIKIARSAIALLPASGAVASSS